MRVPLNWMKEYVELDRPAEWLAEKLTLTGLKVEGIERFAADFEGVLVGRIAAVDELAGPAPLRVAQIELGDRQVQVVSGAPNLNAAAVGQCAPYAGIGARLPGLGEPIGRRTFGGVDSEGMLCSEAELGLGDDHSGIWLLPPDAPVGEALQALVGAAGDVLEFEIYPNRPDCLSVVGIAREAAAVTGATLRPPVPEIAESQAKTADAVRVTIEAPEHCTRYIARLVDDVTVGPSPAWLQERLRAAGMRSVNNVVDVSNYVMLELGQPLHTFDFARLAGGRITVRPAKEGEAIQTLDGQARALAAGMLVIADAEAPIAVAGVMGGAASEVTANTRRILIESAHFAPVAVRRAAQALGLRTEASARFEKGLDPNLCLLAADRAAALLAGLAGGRVAAGKVDVQAAPLPRPRRLVLRPERVGAMLGVQLSPAEIRRQLTALGFGVDLEARHLAVEVPTFRGDVEGEADLIEEVARLYGFDRIEPTLPVGESLPGGYMSPLDRYERARDLLVAAGLHEAITYSFINPEALARLGLADGDPRRRAVTLRNPLSEEHAVMRTSLLPGLLAAAAYNRRRRIESVRLFELGTIFQPREWPVAGQPDEIAHLCALLAGGPPVVGSETARAYDFYDVKGLVELLAERFAASLEVRAGSEPFLHPGRQAALYTGDGKLLGWVGQLHPAVAGAFDLDGEVYACELDLSLLCAGEFTPRHTPISRYPRVQRDLAILVDVGVYASRIEAAIAAAAGPLLNHLALFDVYEGERIPAGKRSLAYALTFGSTERTLTEDEVERAIEQVVEHLRTNLNAEIRGRA